MWQSDTGFKVFTDYSYTADAAAAAAAAAFNKTKRQWKQKKWNVETM